MEHHHRADDVADAVANRRGRVLDRHFVARLRDEHGIVSERNHAAFFETAHDRVVYTRTGIRVDDRHDVVDGPAARVTNLPSGQVLGHRVDVIDIALGIGRDDTVTDRLQRDLGAFLLLEDTSLRAFSFGDVGDRTFVGDDIALFIADRARVLEHDDLGAVLAPQSVFKILDDALRLESRKNALTVDRVDVQHRRTARVLEFRGGFVTEHFDQRRVDGDQIALSRRDIDTVDDAFEEPAVTRLTGLQPVLVHMPLDSDAGQTHHAADLVEFVGSRLLRRIEIDVQRADNPARVAIDRERPARRKGVLRCLLFETGPSFVFGYIGGDLVARRKDRGTAGNAGGIHFDEVEQQLELLGQARRLFDRKRLVLDIQQHDCGTHSAADLFSAPANRPQGPVERRA